MSDVIAFRRIHGRIIPVKAGGNPLNKASAGKAARLAGHAAVIGGAGYLASKSNKKGTLQPNRGLQAVGFATNVASGILSGATMFSGGKKFWASQAGSFGLDAVSSTANVASFAGKGKLKQRAKLAAKQEVINNAAGYAAFGATLLSSAKGRAKLLEYGQKAVSLAKAAGGRIGRFGMKVAL